MPPPPAAASRHTFTYYFNQELGEETEELEETEPGSRLRERLYQAKKNHPSRRPRVLVLDEDSGAERVVENGKARSWAPSELRSFLHSVLNLHFDPRCSGDHHPIDVVVLASARNRQLVRTVNKLFEPAAVHVLPIRFRGAVMSLRDAGIDVEEPPSIAGLLLAPRLWRGLGGSFDHKGWFFLSGQNCSANLKIKIKLKLGKGKDYRANSETLNIKLELDERRTSSLGRSERAGGQRTSTTCWPTPHGSWPQVGSRNAEVQTPRAGQPALKRQRTTNGIVRKLERSVPERWKKRVAGCV